MPRVRSKGPDIVVRFRGGRLRVTKDWRNVHEEAIEKLRSEGGDLLEVYVERVPRTEELEQSAKPKVETDKPQHIPRKKKGSDKE